MPDRVLMQGGAAAALRVSLPGYSAQSDPLNRMALDSRFSNLETVLRGSVNVDRSLPTNIALGPLQTLYFGFTLPAPPLGVFTFGTWDSVSDYFTYSPNYLRNHFTGSAQPAVSHAYVILTPSYMQFGLQGGGPMPTTLWYTLFRRIIT